MLLALGTPKLVERCTAARGPPGLLQGVGGREKGSIGSGSENYRGTASVSPPTGPQLCLSWPPGPAHHRAWPAHRCPPPTPVVTRPHPQPPPSAAHPAAPSFSSFSIMALRAWEAEVLGRLCAFISSFFFSAWRFSSAARLLVRGLVSSSRSKILGDGEATIRVLPSLKPDLPGRRPHPTLEAPSSHPFHRGVH